jgi:hypothetical protein
MVAVKGMDLLIWLENSSLAQLVRQSLYPVAQILHILSFSLFVGAIAIFDLRLLGFARRLPIYELARFNLPLARLSFVVVLGAGILLFLAHPTVLIVNRAFQVKLLTIALAGTNAMAFHYKSFRQMKNWDKSQQVSPSAKIIAICSLILWTFVIVCGRLIAYI